jgi:hypothetical protein
LRRDRIDRHFAREHSRDVAGAFGLQFIERFDRVERGRAATSWS